MASAQSTFTQVPDAVVNDSGDEGDYEEDAEDADEGRTWCWIWENLCPWLTCTLDKQTSIMLVCGGVLIILGVIAGRLLEEWSMIKCFYFVMQVMTTIGYGDITVTSSRMKVFTAIWCLLLLIFGGGLLNQLMARHITKRNDQIRSTIRKVWILSTDYTEDDEEEIKRNYGMYNKLIASTIFLAWNVFFGTVYYRIAEVCILPDGHSAKLGANETCDDVGGHTKGFAESFYMSVITCTTVGFGDHVPRTEFGRLVSVFWMPIGVASAAFFIESVSSVLANLKNKRPLWETFNVDAVTESEFLAMDKTGSGYVTRAEFQGYVLEKSGILPRDIWDAIDGHYDDLDPLNTNKVTWQSVKSIVDAHRQNSRGNLAAERYAER